MPAVHGWTEADLAAREQVFEALVAKSVRMSLRPLTLNLGSIITAAGYNPRQPRDPSGEWTRVSYDITSVWATEVPDLLTEVEGDDKSAEFMRNALEAQQLFSGLAFTYVARHPETGKLTGVITAVEHSEDSNNTYLLIDYVGSRGMGAGTQLVGEIVKTAHNVGYDAIYAEPSDQAALDFWEKQGFTLDPLDLGSEMVGINQSEIEKWLDKHSLIFTAATTPSVSASPTNPQPVLALAETGVVTATWETYVARELYPFVTQTFVDSAAATLGGIETALDVSIPKVTESYAQDYLSAAFNRLNGIGDLIWSLIRGQLTDGYALGESIHQLAARIRSVAGLTVGRANAVARTEVLSAANLGSFAQVQLGGFSDDECEKEWEATEDERTRPAHVEADGQRVPLSQPFSVGGEGLMVPGDPSGRADNVIQCRCTVLYHFADDADVDSDDLQLQPLTAADFVEKEHPRDVEGKFAKKLRGTPIPAPASTTIKLFDNQATRRELGDWYGQLTRDRWAKISEVDRNKIIAIADEESIDGKNHHLSDVLNALRLGIPRVGLRHVKNMPENVMFESDAKDLTKWYESLTPLDYRRLVNSDWGASLANVAERQKTKGNPKPLAKLQELRAAAKANPTEGLVQDTPAVDAARARVAALVDIGVPATEGVNAHQIDAKRAEQIQATLNGGSMTWPAGPQRTALKSYTDSTYRQVNDVLRRPEAFGDEHDKIRYLERAADAQSAMKPWPEDTIVYRGTGSTQFGLDLDYDQFWRLNELVGETFIDRGFTSTTVSSDQSFSNDIRLEIVVPRGTPAAYVGVVSDHSDENELVLAAGTRFKVLSVDVRDRDEERENDYRISEVTSEVDAVMRLQVVP